MITKLLGYTLNNFSFFYFLYPSVSSVFSTNGSLTRHLKTHTGEKPYKCSLCTKAFTQSCSLQLHVRSVHKGEKPKECQICGKRFRDTGKLNIHIMSHTGERSLKCELCEKRFIQQDQLVAHMRWHTREKPFKCDVCGRSFAHISNLKAHKNRVHDHVRPYKCYDCGKGFSRRNQCATHQMTHHGGIVKDKECDLCGDMFRNGTELRMHIRMHLKEKPFKCNTCRVVAFVTEKELREHATWCGRVGNITGN